MAEESKKDALAEEIMNDARRQAERKLNRARRSAERIVKSAESRTKAVEQKAVEEAEAQLEREAKMILADIPHQEQVRRLKVKDVVIGRLVAESLDLLRSRADILPALVRLSSEAVANMDGDSFVLEVSERDAAGLGGPLAEKTIDEVKKARNRSITVRVVASAERNDGGVVVKSADSAQMVDNSFGTRMRRARQGLRGRIAQLIFGEEPE